jgi:hypothetical protein
MYVTIAVFAWSNRLLTARTLDEKLLLQCCIVGLTDLLRSKLEVGVGFLLYSHLQKPFWEPMMTAASFSCLDRYNTFKG